MSFVKDLPDGRRFANDSRGFLYLLDASNQPHVYANVAEAFPYAIYNRLESGFIGFAFHPEFARNGLFYTVHSERGPGNPKTPDFIPIGYGLKDVTYHNVITEWHATNPAANTFEGTRRELLREAHVVAEPHPSDGRGRVQPDREARRCRLRPALHQRQRSWLQQWRRTECEQSRPDAASRLDHDRHPAHRSAQPVGHARRRRDSATTPFRHGQQVRRRRRSQDARRDLRLRLPQRAPAVVGHGRRHDVRLRHRDGPDRGDQHRPQRRELRLDEARGLFPEWPSAGRRAQPVVPAAGRRF